MSDSVSAVITTYNYGKFITDAIESVLSQTRPPDEVIVIDDGSTDDTHAVVERYSTHGVRYVRQQNSGAGAARNRGLRECQGSLIAFLDADDVWLPEKIALQVDHLVRFPEEGLVTGSEWQVFDDGRDPWKLERPAYANRSLAREILIENCLGNPSLVLLRRSCFGRAGPFDESLPLGQDWDMWIRIAQEFTVGCVGDPLIQYRHHPNSISDGRAFERFQANRALFRRHIQPVRPWYARWNLLRAAYSMNYYYVGATLIDQGAGRRRVLPPSLAALVLDPVRQARWKSKLAVRSLIGTERTRELAARLRHRR